MTDHITHHRPTLARELFGAPRLVLAPNEHVGNRVVVYGWELVGGERRFYLDAAKGALLYVVDTKRKSAEACYAPDAEQLLTEVEHQFVTRPSEVAHFKRVFDQAVERWPYMADTAHWLGWEPVALSSLY